jgi:hypothetical protein
LCTQRGVDLREEAESYALGSTIGFAAGGGLVITGLVLLLTAPSKRQEMAHRPLQVAVDLTHGSRGLRVGGAF